MKINLVKANNKKKCLEVKTQKGTFHLPYAKLELKPTIRNPIELVYVDKELGRQAVTYRLASGDEDSVHLDAFLDYNADPAYLRNLILHQLTIEAKKRLPASGITKNEIIRRLQTSASQLYRLLDPANTQKSVDELLRLLSVLGLDVKLSVKELGSHQKAA